VSDHFDGRRFFNPQGPAVQPFAAVPKLMREPRARWPAAIDVSPRQPPERGAASAVVTFVGHSTFLIQTAAGNILTDPMYSRRAGPFRLLGPRRVRQPAVRFEDLPAIAVVLLSHNHYDHCDRATLARLAKRFDPLVATPVGNAALVRSAGIRRVEELDWWEHAATAGLPIALTPAHHFSARTPFDRNRALWGGFVVQAGARRIYFAGDTAYAPFLSEVRRRLGPIDLALLPIGAYEPRWFMRSVHMNPDEAVEAHVDLGARVSLGMHYGTFRLTSEGIDDPLRALEEARARRKISPSEFGVLGFGESYRLE
jgi:L-ascorbate metabolism protein UlaG (beta-lactamase superfamily)